MSLNNALLSLEIKTHGAQYLVIIEELLIISHFGESSRNTAFNLSQCIILHEGEIDMVNLFLLFVESLIGLNSTKDQVVKHCQSGE